MSTNEEPTSIRHRFGGKFDELRGRYVNTPELMEQYERTVRAVVAIRKLLMAIDEERRRQGRSKSELARRIQMDDSSIRRIFASETSNPTLRTVVEMLSALNMRLEVKPRDEGAPAAARPRQRKKERVAV